MSAETVDDPQEWIPWELDPKTMTQRAAPPVYFERQAALIRQLHIVASGSGPAVDLPPDEAVHARTWTRAEMLAGRRAVDRHREGRGPEPTPLQRAAYLAMHRAGRKPRREPLAAAEMLEALESGLTLSEVARSRGILEESVLARLTKAGRRDVVDRLRGRPSKPPTTEGAS